MKRYLGLLLLIVTSQAIEVRATTFIPMSIEDLARSSAATVVGTVQGLTAVRSHSGAVFTLVRVAVEEVVKGELLALVVILKEDGGIVGNQHEVVLGAPRFAVGERVLLFLTVRRDGSLRTNHLALGKFHLEIGVNGMPIARPDFDPGAMTGGRLRDTNPNLGIPLNEVLAAVQRAPNPALHAAALVSEPEEATDPSLATNVVREFTVNGVGRFFEPDEGTPLAFLIDQRGDTLLGLAAARSSVANAFAAWTGVPTASASLQDGGLTSNLDTPCPGPHKILFDDPDGTIPDPINCHGTLAVGVACATTFESKHFNGITFERALRGKVTFASGWDGCPDVWTACNLAEIATHEIGHVIGLGHSSEDPNETNLALRDATMYFTAHFDGRCAAVKSYDIGAVSFVYPTAIPPTITTASPLPNGSFGVAYHQTLVATGGAGSFTWSLAGGGFPGLTLSASGVISGTPSGGSGFFQVKATDGNGDSHTKVLNITVSGPTATKTVTVPATRTSTQTATPPPTNTPPATSSATPTDTPTPTATATPTASATSTDTATPTNTTTSTPTVTPSATSEPTPSPTAPVSTPSTTATPCAGDCDHSSDVTISEILTLVDIALGKTGLQACQAGDANHDGFVTIEEILAAVNAALRGCA